MSPVEGAHLIVKTQRGLEDVAASHIADVAASIGVRATVRVRPMGYLGLVTVEVDGDKWALAGKVADEVPEASRVLVVEAWVPARLDDIVRASVEVARGYVGPGDTFAVRTTRRGEHDFTSVDVNVGVGAAIREATGAEVDLERPSKPIYVEIFGGSAAICVPATPEYRKMDVGKPMPLAALRRVTIAQMIYEGPRDAVRNLAVRIGRAAQTFEVGELYAVHYRPLDGDTVRTFLEGLEEGIQSRYEVQRRSYGRPVHRVRVYVYDLYQFVRLRRGEPIVVTDPKGAYVSRVGERLADLYRRGRLNVLVGAREGIPTGVFRFADLVVDLIPQVTISTDYVIPSLAIALVSVLDEAGLLDRYRGKKQL